MGIVYLPVSKNSWKASAFSSLVRLSSSSTSRNVVEMTSEVSVEIVIL